MRHFSQTGKPFGSQARKVLTWILLTESMLILSTRLGTFLHEFIGHGVTAMLLGGDFESFRLTLFAGGEARFSGNFSQAARIAVSLGGIAINLITGLAALRLARSRRLSFSFRLFSLILAGVSILSQLQYLALGAYYQYSDLSCLADCHPVVLFPTLLGGLLALAVFSFLIMSIFFQFQEASFPSPHPVSRAFITFLILGIPVLLYAGFYHWSAIPLGSTAAIMESRLQAEEAARRIKIETGTSEDIEEIRERLEPRPLLPWIIAIYALTTLAALLRPAGPSSSRQTLGSSRTDAAPKDYFPPLPSSLLATLPWLIAAGLVLALIAFRF
ncbi:MAG: M50 family metallopeptidase [bacterium]